MNAKENVLAAHAPCPKFDTLFADHRHYRADCRLMRTAIRQGWLNGAPQADREALVARFNEACAKRRADDPETRNIRAQLAEIGVMADLHKGNMDLLLRLGQYAWGGELPDRDLSKGGRPRQRWHVTDYPNRLDAHKIRRQAEAEGRDLAGLRSILVLPAGLAVKPGEGGERIALEVEQTRRFGCRVWLVCPRCKQRRQHLYPVRVGHRCRECAGVVYSG